MTSKKKYKRNSTTSKPPLNKNFHKWTNCLSTDGCWLIFLAVTHKQNFLKRLSVALVLLKNSSRSKERSNLKRRYYLYNHILLNPHLKRLLRVVLMLWSGLIHLLTNVLDVQMVADSTRKAPKITIMFLIANLPLTRRLYVRDSCP